MSVSVCKNCIYYHKKKKTCSLRSDERIEPNQHCSFFKIDHRKLRKNRTEKEEERKETSLYIDENIIAEQIKKNKESLFCIYDIKNNSVKYNETLELEHETFYPIESEEVQKDAIKLPSGIVEYGTDEKLDIEIKEHIKKWLDIPKEVLQFAVWNIKRSWVYERFHTLNYLRALGEAGMGKSRFLDTLGYLHYKPIATSGATTAAPVFRIIEKWRGTLIMDEADFTKSDEAQDIIKIINMGYEKGKYVMRCDMENKKDINFFDPYCPKILATRKSFKDKATESRCITSIMKGTNRKDIKFNLNKDFWEKTEELRNKLLLWRFRNYHKINPEEDIDFEIDVEPRIKQIVNSFITLFSTEKGQLDKFKKFILKCQDELIEERKNTFAGLIVESIYSMLEEGKNDISNQDIIEKGGLNIHPRGLTNTLKTLGFSKPEVVKIDGKSKRCLPLKPNHLNNLMKRYGYGRLRSYEGYGTYGTKVKKTYDYMTSQKSEDMKLSNILLRPSLNRNSVTFVTENINFDDTSPKNTKKYKIENFFPAQQDIYPTVTSVSTVTNQILAVLKKKPNSSTEEISKATSISTGELYPTLLKMKKEGIIFCPKKLDYWMLIE